LAPVALPFGAPVSSAAFSALASGDLVLFQIASEVGPAFVMNGVGALPLPASIISIVRPEAIEKLVSSRKPRSPSIANSSRCLMSSQFSRLLDPPLANLSLLIRTSTQPPFIRSPAKTSLISPFFRPFSRSKPGSGAHQPRSHSITVPPPYWPSGIVPSKSP
jgi:hypothetical protein